MNLVVDTNILYTYFWKQSFARRIFMRQDLDLFAPEFALEEINSHKHDIVKKTELSEKEFLQTRSDLAIAVEFVPLEEYNGFLKDAGKISPDPNDIDFFALAMKLGMPLWSNDALLKKQKLVKILSTSDLLSKPEFSDIVFPDD